MIQVPAPTVEDTAEPELNPVPEAASLPTALATAEDATQPEAHVSEATKHATGPGSATPPLGVFAAPTDIASLVKAEQDYVEASLEVARLEEEISSKKEELKEAQELQRTLGRRVFRLRDGETETTEPTPQDRMEAVEPSDWAKFPTIDLGLQNCDGMGEKKFDSILDRCPTAGDLEALRAGDGFTSLRGVGESLASKMEDMLLDYLTRTRDRAAFEAVEADVVEVEPVEPEPEPGSQPEHELEPEATDKPSTDSLSPAGETSSEPEPTPEDADDSPDIFSFPS